MNDDADKKRRLLLATTTIVGGAGMAAATLPFIASMMPSARARSEGGPVTANISKLEPGQQLTVSWRRKPVWILRRTEDNLQDLKQPLLRKQLRDPDSEVRSQQPDYTRKEFRSIRPDYLIVIGLCTHLGCVPLYRPERAPLDLGTDWRGGYFCPCHGSRFDLAGRVFRNVPAPTNLIVPPHRFLSENIVEIGEDTVAA